MTPISKPSYIKRVFERFFKRLQTDYVDLYYQHRDLVRFKPNLRSREDV